VYPEVRKLTKLLYFRGSVINLKIIIMRSKIPIQKSKSEKAWDALVKNGKDINCFTEKYDRYIEEMHEDRKKREKETKKFEQRMEAMQKEMGGISNSNGDVAESYFYLSLADTMYFAGQEYDGIFPKLKQKNKKLKLQGEYDIVMYNGTSVAIIEVKFRAHEDHIPTLLRKAETFRMSYPRYKGYKIYLGLASMSFHPGVEKECIAQGVAVIKQVGDTVVINDEHLKTW
jgi:hypothetical protein